MFPETQLPQNITELEATKSPATMMTIVSLHAPYVPAVLQQSQMPQTPQTSGNVEVYVNSRDHKKTDQSTVGTLPDGFTMQFNKVAGNTIVQMPRIFYRIGLSPTMSVFFLPLPLTSKN